VRRTRFNRNYCPIARTTDLLGDWWTPLVLRELVLGNQKFGSIQESLEISRPVLTERLNRLVDEGVVERVPYQERPVRYRYVITDKGRALWDVLLAMWQFGDDWMFRNGAPAELFHKESGERVEPMVVDRKTGEPLTLDNTRIRIRERS